MDELWQQVITLLTGERILSVLRAVLILTIGILLARLLGTGIGRVVHEHVSTHHKILIRRFIFYLILILFLISALRELGFQLGVLLGAAGVLTVAVGFASQTSASNLISGLFLLGERPFSVGDIIKIGSSTGRCYLLTCFRSNSVPLTTSTYAYRTRPLSSRKSPP
jgi:small-conductance mechanosensitive channel